MSPADPVAIALLFPRPSAGLWLTHGVDANWMYYSQVTFLAFMLFTFRVALHPSGPDFRRFQLPKLVIPGYPQ